MNCAVFYDLTEQGFGQWRFLFLGLGLAAVGIFLFLAGKAFSHSRSPLGRICYLLFRVGGAGFALGWLVVGVYPTYQSYIGYRNLVQERAAGRERFIQGVITNFSSYGSKPSSHPRESFMIDGKMFTYSPSEIRPGFNQIQENGSPIHDGTAVRLGYIEDTISRLEICR